MKAKIFIGSSSESLIVAEQIKRFFESEYECTIWRDHFFSLNQSTYDTLLKKASSFDYAIFIGGKDDLVTRLSSGETRKSVRDNVYFELGLYTGILSKYRTYFFLRKEVYIASDLLGITIIQYEQLSDVLSGCHQVREKIQEEEKINRISLLPSTSIAFNYYKNFLEPLGNRLSESEHVFYEGDTHHISLWMIRIVLPRNCNWDWAMWAKEFYKYHCCGNCEVSGNPRKISVKFNKTILNHAQTFQILDVPQTLCASFEAIEMLLGKDYIGYTKEITDLKEKEVWNFIKTLKNLIEHNPILNQKVDILQLGTYDLDIE